MLDFKSGDMFIEIDKYQAAINTVNCVGVMGKGIALAFKKKFPGNYEHYIEACNSSNLIIGKCLVHEQVLGAKPQYIINFPTKKHWRSSSKREYIEKGLDDLVKIIEENQIKSLIMPALGCGNGNLDWLEIKSLIIEKLHKYEEVKITIIEPPLEKTLKMPELTTERKKLLLLFNDYQLESKTSSFTFKEANYLCYLLAANDKNIRLNFLLTAQGPFAEGINSILLSMKDTYLLPQQIEESTLYHLKVLSVKFHKKKEILRDVSYLTTKNLIKEFKTSNELLILCIVHWLRTESNVPSDLLKEKLSEWLVMNNLNDIEDNIREKAINRILKLYTINENLTLDI